MSETIENITVQRNSYRFQQCIRTFEVKVYIALKHELKFIDIFRFIKGSLREIDQHIRRNLLAFHKNHRFACTFESVNVFFFSIPLS